jgi:hypothetical protein
VKGKALSNLWSDPSAGCIPKRDKGDTVHRRVVVDVLTAPAVKRRQPEFELETPTRTSDAIRQDVQDHWSVELRVGRPV